VRGTCLMEITSAYQSHSIRGGYLIIIKSGALGIHQSFADLDKSLYTWIFMRGMFLMDITPAYIMCFIRGYNRIII
jgi:hypothetical protein